MPVTFCPFCYNMLFPLMRDGRMHVTCTICPHAWPIKKPIKVSYKYEGKKIDTKIRTEADQRPTGPRTDINCPRCDNTEAYFEQMQTRSADEPMTIFYKCTSTKCNHTWKE